MRFLRRAELWRWLVPAVLCLAPLQEGTQSAPPAAAPATYLGRPIAPPMSHEAASWLTRTERAKEENTELMLAELGVQPGQRVCDFGCGNGYLTLPLARLVGEEGRVVAVDIQPQMLELLMERAEQAGLGPRIEPLLATESDPLLEKGSVDLVLMVDVYHELAQPAQILAAVRAALKPKGRLVLVEFRLEDPEVPIKTIHKMSKEQIRLEMTANRFQVVREFDGLPWQHMVFLEVVPEPSTGR